MSEPTIEPTSQTTAEPAAPRTARRVPPPPPPRSRGLFIGIVVGINIVIALALFMVVYLTDSGTDDRTRAAWLVRVGFGASAVMLAIGYLQLQRKHIGLFALCLGHFIWFAWPAVLTLEEGRFVGDLAAYRVPDDSVVTAALLTSFFFMVSLATYALFSRLAPLDPPDFVRKLERAKRVLPTLGWFLTILFVLGVVPFLLYGGGIREVISGILAARSSEKPWSMGAHIVNENGPVVVIGRAALATFSGLALWLTVSRRRFGLSGGATAAALFFGVLGLLVTYFDSGTRSWTIIIIGPTLVAAFVGRLSRRRLVRGGLTALGLFLAVTATVQLQRYYRFTASIEGITLSDVFYIQDNDFFTETAIAVDLVPRQTPYIQQFEPILFVTNPIPRYLWEEKPYSKTVRYYSLGRSGFDEYLRTGTSRMPSIVGQHWMSWGIAGVAGIAIFWGWAFAFFDSLYRRSPDASLASFLAMLGIVWLFLSWRGLYPGFHYPVVLVSLIVWWMRRTVDRAERELPAAVSEPVAERVARRDATARS